MGLHVCSGELKNYAEHFLKILTIWCIHSVLLKDEAWDFPGGAMVKNPPARGFPGGAVVESLPANAGDTGSSPGLGRSHMPRSGWAREPQLLSLRVWSLCSATREARASR